MDHGPQLGRMIGNGELRRDAIHIAVAPVTASCRLAPGEHVGLIEKDNVELVGPCAENIGIVDPFLSADVEAGHRFWLLLYPDTITGLRHVWTHPAYSAVAAAVAGKLR